MTQFLLLFLLQITIIISQNKSNTPYTISPHDYSPVRVERAGSQKFPKKITIKLIENRTHLKTFKFVKTEGLLANRNLPVWSILKDTILKHEHEHSEKVMDSIIMYHDLEQSSAIIYFEPLSNIYGNIDTSFYINGFNVSNLRKKLKLKVGENYLMENPDRFLHGKIDPFVWNQKPPFRKDSYPLSKGTTRNPTRKCQKLTTSSDNSTIYLETLVIITYDVLQTFKEKYGNSFMTMILLEYMVYFNSVDMLIAKLTTEFEVYVNLAGIIMEKNMNAFSHLMKTRHFNQYHSTIHLDVNKAFPTIDNFIFFQNTLMFPDYSFDYIILSTRRPLRNNRNFPSGVTEAHKNIYEKRLRQGKSMAFIPKSIVTKENLFNDFAVTAHEIGHVLGSEEHDSKDYHYVNGYQCYGIMQCTNPYCFNCLKWTQKSIRIIEKYLANDRYRCWLLNFPRSLHLYNQPRIYKSASDQCRCYGYNSHETTDEHIPEDACGKRMACVIDGRLESTQYPHDGTPCSSNGEKVCWKNRCIETSSYVLTTSSETLPCW